MVTKTKGDGRARAAAEAAVIREREGVDLATAHKRRKEIIAEYGSMERWPGFRPAALDVSREAAGAPAKADPVEVMGIARELYAKAGGKDAAVAYINAFDQLSHIGDG